MFKKTNVDSVVHSGFYHLYLLSSEIQELSNCGDTFTYVTKSKIATVWGLWVFMTGIVSSLSICPILNEQVYGLEWYQELEMDPYWAFNL
jgi:hypothetical protein